MTRKSHKKIVWLYALPMLLFSLLAVASRPPQAMAQAPKALLPGDSAPSVAVGNQDNPQIASGNGMYLAVWEDSRTNYANFPDNAAPSGGSTSGQTLKDIFAARIDGNGQLIDSAPIVVSLDTRSQTVPQVSWNGQNWLVVWNAERKTESYYTKDIMAARVSPQGQVLDSPAIIVDANPSIDELWPTVASDGTNWVVIWMDQGSYFELDATRIGPDGTVLNPGGVAIHTPAFPDAPYNAAATFAGDEYLVVWSGNNQIKAKRFSTTLQPIGGVFVVGASGNMPEVSTDGTNFFVAWQFANDTYGARVTHAGQVLDPSGINISGSNGGFPYPDVAWDGTNWLVTWVPYANNAMLARVSPSGQVLDPSGLVVSANASVSAVVGRPGGGAVEVWTDFHLNGLGQGDIFMANVSADGVPGTSAPVSMGAPRQLGPDLASNGSGYLAVFQSSVSGETRIKGQRLNADGSPIDTEPFPIAGGSRTFGRPRASWNGSVYLVVWEDSSINRGFVPGAILGKRLDVNGNVLDINPFEILPGNAPDVSALGSGFLVVSTSEATNHIRIPKAATVSDQGTVGAVVNLGTSYSVNITVDVLGSRWLSVWQRHPTHDSPYGSIYGTFINSDGTPSGEFLVTTGATTATKPDIATGPTQALISYFLGSGANVYQGDIYAKRIQPDGTLLDGGSGIRVTSAANAQFFPSGAWTGSEYVLAFEDYRNVPYIELPVSDIFGARVGEDGTVLDPNSFVISNDPAPEVNPLVQANPSAGSYLIAFGNFRTASPYAAYRVDIRYGQAGSPPTPAPTNTPTSVLTSTPTPAASSPTATRTVVGTSTPADTATSTPISTSVSTSTATATFTSTSIPTSTPAGPTATGTRPTATSTPSATSAPAQTATATPVACSIQFSDVPSSSTFYSYIECLACQGIVSGYQDGTFHPNNPVTRGQAAKIVANSAGYNENVPSTTQTFSDVPLNSTFWLYVERVALHGAINGYADGTFRPSNNVTRGQLAKIDAEVKGYNDVIPPSQQTFSDEAPNTTFWVYVERVALHNVVSGYSDGTFRSNNPVTRGQAAKVVSNTFFPDCNP